MKKLLIVATLSFLLVSCGGSSVDVSNTWAVEQTGAVNTPWVTDSTGTIGASTGWVVIWDENTKDPGVSTGDAGSPTITNTWTTKPTSTKSEDQIVKDFEKEIDSLLNTIDKDGTTKK